MLLCGYGHAHEMAQASECFGRPPHPGLWPFGELALCSLDLRAFVALPNLTTVGATGVCVGVCYFIS